MPAADALSRLVHRLETRYRGRITGSLLEPALPARHAEFPDGLDPRLRAALAARGIERPYIHQRAAWDALARGEDIVVVTPTASGKTLCYNLPVIQAVLGGQGKALYLFPTKALAQDQVAELSELSRAGDLGLRAFTFDGDTPADARRAVRSRADIVVSNPDMLHQAILPQHTKWAQFFEALRYVVIDEVHGYRGVFGSHVANLLRRLGRICAFYSVSPRFVLCSATIGNPREHAEALLGRQVTAIRENGAPRGARRLLLWNPPVVNPDLGIRASARSQSTRIARLAIAAGLKTIVFAQSRLMAEVLTKYLKDRFDTDPRKPERVRAYRGGHLPEERRRTERALRAGEIDCVVSTSALELGVDIGALDVCVLNGYPGSIAATWQRLGRAGRRQREALGVLVASSEPLDQYVVSHPEYFLEATPEQARIAPDQPLVLLDHIRCAAFELPFEAGEGFGGIDPSEFLAYLESEGVLHRDGRRWYWVADSYPAQAVSLRSVANGNFVVIDRSHDRQQVIAEVDYHSAALTLYEGAIYLVQSQPWQVERLDWVGRKAFVTRTRADYYTEAIDDSRLKILERFASVEAGQGACGWGEVHLVRHVSGYKKIRYYSHENIGYGPIDLPDLEMHTTAVWWQIDAAVLDLLFDERSTALEGFLGAAYALHTVACVLTMSEARDLGKAVGNGDASWSLTVDVRGRGSLRSAEGASLAPGQLQRFQPAVFLYDNHPGGLGLSEALHARRKEVLAAAARLVETCACRHGCPACVGPVLSGDGRRPLSARGAASRVLGLLSNAAEPSLQHVARSGACACA